VCVVAIYVSISPKGPRVERWTAGCSVVPVRYVRGRPIVIVPIEPMVEDDEGDSMDHDDALAELLGVTSLSHLIEALSIEEENNLNEHNSLLPPLVRDGNEEQLLEAYLQEVGAPERYQATSVYRCTKILALSAKELRRMTLELLHNPTYRRSSLELTWETIGTERVITRLENFVNVHPEWKELCYGYVQTLVSSLMGEQYLLYKEKLNFKPPGGSGFAPHVDTPSLRAPFSPDVGPHTFVTVMIAIDTMTSSNGCLRVVEGRWFRLEQEQLEKASNIVEVLPYRQDGNPDDDGRAGAIPLDTFSQFHFQDIECDGGDIVLFHGWTPHRSSKNTSPFARRAVFLTYNPLREGDFHDEYYRRMAQLRHNYSTTLQQVYQLDYQMDLKALSSVPA
jgi:hypothetical protein